MSLQNNTGVMFFSKIFTNSDKAHASRVLHRLGLEDCFERVISFETLNSSNEDGSEYKPSSTGIFDFYEYIHRPNSDVVLPRTPVVCKPFQDAFEKVFNMADIDPPRTVRLPILLFPSLSNTK